MLNVIPFYDCCLVLLPRLLARQQYGFHTVGLMVGIAAYTLLRGKIDRFFASSGDPSRQVVAGRQQAWLLAVYRGTFQTLGDHFARQHMVLSHSRLDSVAAEVDFLARLAYSQLVCPAAK